MKLIDARSRFTKEYVYDTYIRIVYDFVDYDCISRKEMLKEIIKSYHEKNFLFSICTKRELNFISKFYKKKISINNYNKYKWEIMELNKKYIFNLESLSFYEDYDDIIPNVIEFYKNNKLVDFNVLMFIVSFVRINGEVLSNSILSFASELYGIKDDDFNKILGSPLIHFYCDFDCYDELDNPLETIYFRDYYDFIYELREKRKVLGVASDVPFDIKLYEDFYYYGLNYSNSIVKKFYDKFFDDFYDFYLFDFFDECRVLGNSFPSDFNLFGDSDYVNDVLYEIPCAAMNGVSPRQRDKAISENNQLMENFSCIPQNNAHVHKDICKKYYYYYFALLEYINNEFKINTNIKKIFKQTGLDVNELVSIDDYLWNHLDVIDNFIKENPFNFNSNDFYYVKQFKTALKDNEYVIIGFEREYTKVLSSDNKIYMVKGLNCDIDKVINSSNIPCLINTHLLMFENYIIYNGFISNYNVILPNSFKKSILKDLDGMMKYYHL